MSLENIVEYSAVLKAQPISSIDLTITIGRTTGTPIFYGIENKYLLFIYIVYTLVLALTYNVGYIYYEIIDLAYAEDIAAFTQNFCLTAIHLCGTTKYFNAFYQRKELTFIIDEMKKLTTKYIVTEEQEKTLKKNENQNKFVLTIFSTTIIVTAAAGFITLIINPSLGGHTFPYRAMLPDFLPFCFKSFLWISGTGVLAYQVVTIDCINFNMINHVRLQLKLLSITINNIKSINDINAIYVLLKECIIHHNLIINLRNKIESYFTITILFQFLASLVIFAMTGFQIIVLAGSSDALIIYLYMTGPLVELYGYCWFANQTMEQNNILSTVIFSTPWYKFEPRASKLILIFLINSQRPMRFTAGGFFDLSLSTFTGLLSRSYTYIAVLRQMYTNPI